MNKILPKTIDNNYQGSKLALFVFYLITVIALVRSLIHMLSPDSEAQSIATIPLDSYASTAAATVIYLFSVWGLSQLLMGFFYVLASLKYKALLPLMYTEYTGRFIIGHLKPIAITGTAPEGTMNLPMALLSLAMLALSLYQPKKK